MSLVLEQEVIRIQIAAHAAHHDGAVAAQLIKVNGGVASDHLGRRVDAVKARAKSGQVDDIQIDPEIRDQVLRFGSKSFLNF